MNGAESHNRQEEQATMASNPVSEFITKLMEPKSKGEAETLVRCALLRLLSQLMSTSLTLLPLMPRAGAPVLAGRGRQVAAG